MPELYHTAILKNAKTGRFHPISFRPAPRPSDDISATSVCRHRSLGHHTEGFETEDKAMAWIDKHPNAALLGAVFEWDGEGVPATTADLPFEVKEVRNA